jgi:hypothetical protein
MFRIEYEDILRQQHEREVEAEKQRLIAEFKSKTSRSREIKEWFGKFLIAAGERLVSNQASIHHQPEFQLRR